MIRFLLPLLLLPLLSGTAARADALRGPPTFNGFVLGMTLDEMRSKAFPDKEQAGARLICSGDRLAEESQQIIGPSAEEAKAGVKTCQYLRTAGDGKWQDALLGFGGHKLLTYFSISPKTNDMATSERLYRIGVLIAPAMFDEIAEALKGQFGAPNTAKSRPLANPSGGLRNSRSLGWYGKGYAVFLAELMDGQEYGGIAYNDASIEAVVDRLVAAGPAATAPPPAPPSATAPSSATAMKLLPDSVGLRGFNLGTTLADFRRQKYPDASSDEVRLICSGDALSKEAELNFPSSHVHGKIGTKMCRFYTVIKGKVREAPLKVAGHDTQVVFFITPPSANPAFSERLYAIRVEAKGRPFADFVAAYTAEFGKPANPEGASPRNLMWLNLRTRLLVNDDPREGVNVLYYDTDMESAVDALKSKR